MESRCCLARSCNADVLFASQNVTASFKYSVVPALIVPRLSDSKYCVGASLFSHFQDGLGTRLKNLVYLRVLTRVQLALVANRVPIHQWVWVESIQVTIWVGGMGTLIHTGGKSRLNWNRCVNEA